MKIGISGAFAAAFILFGSNAFAQQAPSTALEWAKSQRLLPSKRINGDLRQGIHTLYGLNSVGSSSLSMLGNSDTSRYVTIVNPSTNRTTNIVEVGRPQDREYRGITGPAEQGNSVFTGAFGPIDFFDLDKKRKLLTSERTKASPEPVAGDSAGGFSVTVAKAPNDGGVLLHVVKNGRVSTLQTTLGARLDSVSIGQVSGREVFFAVLGDHTATHFSMVEGEDILKRGQASIFSPKLEDPNGRWRRDGESGPVSRARLIDAVSNVYGLWPLKNFYGVHVRRAKEAGNDAVVTSPTTSRAFVSAKGGSSYLMDMEGSCKERTNSLDPVKCTIAVSVAFRDTSDGVDAGYVIFLNHKLEPIAHFGGANLVYHDLLRMPDGQLAAAGTLVDEGKRMGLLDVWERFPGL